MPEVSPHCLEWQAGERVLRSGFLTIWGLDCFLFCHICCHINFKKSECIFHVYVSKPSNSSVVGLVQFWHVNGFIKLQLLCECICCPQSKRNKQKHLDMYQGDLSFHLPRAPPYGVPRPSPSWAGTAPSPPA